MMQSLSRVKTRTHTLTLVCRRKPASFTRQSVRQQSVSKSVGASGRKEGERRKACLSHHERESEIRVLRSRITDIHSILHSKCPDARRSTGGRLLQSLAAAAAAATACAGEESECLYERLRSTKQVPLSFSRNLFSFSRLESRFELNR